MTPAEQRYTDGYNAGRTACVQAGTSSGLREEVWRANLDPAYRAGYEWACFDYDDANGLAALPIHYLSRRSDVG